jgi:transcriptional/translational regulatory protein YebC/TACO1
MIDFDGAKYKEDDIIAVALEAGAEDVSSESGSIEVLCEPDKFEAVLDALNKAGFQQENAEVSKIADTTVKLDPDKTQKAMRLIENLEESDDVQNVATNLEMPDE